MMFLKQATQCSDIYLHDVLDIKRIMKLSTQAGTSTITTKHKTTQKSDLSDKVFKEI